LFYNGPAVIAPPKTKQKTRVAVALSRSRCMGELTKLRAHPDSTVAGDKRASVSKKPHLLIAYREPPSGRASSISSHRFKFLVKDTIETSQTY